MAQQINLFDRRFLRQKREFSARLLGRTLTAVVLLLAVVTVAQSIDTTLTRRSIATVDGERETIRGELTRLQARVRPQASPALQDEARRLESAIAAHEQLAARLDSGEFGPTAGVSQYFTALARRTVEGVWLTRIRVDAPSGALMLSGRALKPDLLPVYLDRIAREDALRGRSFAQIRVVAHDGSTDRSTTRTGRSAVQKYVEFELGAPRPPGAVR